jgi:SNF2 family DNA or RNA helicase
MLISAKGRYNLLLSATAAEDPTEMRALGYLLGLFPDPKLFFAWAKRHGCEYDMWKNLQFKASARDAVLRELNRQIYPGRGHKVTRDEMREFFQETHIVTEPMDFGDAGRIAKIYAEMEDELQLLDEARQNDSDNAGAAQLVAVLRARQEVELLKIPVLVDLIDEYLSGHFSVAVFLNFDASISALADKLFARRPHKIPRIWGSQNDKEREDAIRSFQTNESRVIICNVAAGGVGVSLHDQHGGFPRVALISPSWNAKDLIQVTGRVDRAGGKSPTLQRILFAADTVEDKIRAALNKKLANLRTLHNKSV